MYLQPRCCPRCSSSNVHLLLIFHLDVPQVPQTNVQLEFAIFPHKTNPQPRLSISRDWHPGAQARNLCFLLDTSSPRPAAPISHQVLRRLQPASLPPATQAVVLELPSAFLPWVVSGFLIRPLSHLLLFPTATSRSSPQTSICVPPLHANHHWPLGVFRRNSKLFLLGLLLCPPARTPPQFPECSPLKLLSCFLE